jgi:serine/threonine protein kinase
VRSYIRTRDSSGRTQRLRRFEIRLGDLGSAVESLVELSTDLNSVRGSSFDMQRASHYHRQGSGTETLIVGKKRRGSNTPTTTTTRGSIGEVGSDRDSVSDVGKTQSSKSGSAPSDTSSSSHHTEYDESYMYRLNDGVTPNWAAPEVLEAILSVTPKKSNGINNPVNLEDGVGLGIDQVFNDPYSPASDVYSLGVVLWEIATCRAPFEDASFMDLVHRIGRKHETPPLYSFIPRKYRALLSACWRPIPGERPSAMKVVETLKKIQKDVEAGRSSDEPDEAQPKRTDSTSIPPVQR